MTMATHSAVLSGRKSKYSWSGAMELRRHRRGEGGHAACACGEELLRATQWRLSAADKALTRAMRGAKKDGKDAQTHTWAAGARNARCGCCCQSA